MLRDAALGVCVDLNPYHKYATIRSVNSQKTTRLYRLGEAYDRESLYAKMLKNQRNNWQEAYRLYGEFAGKKDFGTTIQRRKFPLKGSFRTVKKVTGLRTLYLHYCYLLGVIPKNKPHRPLSLEMREAWRFLDRYSQQVQLTFKQKLHNLPAVEAFIGKSEEEIKLLTDYRKTLYRKIDRCRDPEEKATLVSKRNDCTTVLAELRRDIKTAGRLIEDNPKIKENIRIEERMRQEIYAPKKQRKREYER